MTPEYISGTARPHTPAAWLGYGLIRGYQLMISPWLGPRCKYYPSCSHYGLDAMAIHGFLKGSALTAGRLLRCNPWSGGGVNHVPPRGSWRRSDIDATVTAVQTSGSYPMNEGARTA